MTFLLGFNQIIILLNYNKLKCHTFQLYCDTLNITYYDRASIEFRMIIFVLEIFPEEYNSIFLHNIVSS